MSTFRSIAALALTFAATCPAQAVNYAEHIAPILYANCVSCHRPGQIAPFSLLTYDDAVRHALTIGAVTQSRYMPPWKPEHGWMKYADERYLTTDQISLIQQWVAAGAPQGPVEKTPATPTFATDWQLGKPDLVLTMPKSYPVAASGDDEYRNFVIPSGITADTWIRAIELKASAPTVLHHALFFSDTTGNARALDGQDGKPGFSGLGAVFTVQGASLSALTGGLGGWVPGAVPQFLPAGIGIPLPKGADVLVQAHFHPTGLAQAETITIGIYLEPKPDREVIQVQAPAFFGIQSSIDIPAGEADYKVRGSFTLPVDTDAISISSHMHYLGKSAKLTATLPTGEVKVLLWIRQWDFRWQSTYPFQDLLFLPAGTRLDGEVTYDNSANNPNNPNSPPKRVQWGEQTTDEMGSMILNVVPHVAGNATGLQNSIVSYILTRAPQVGNKPLFTSFGMVDGAAGAQSGSVTPGKIIVLYGQRLGPSTLASAQVAGGSLTNALAGTQVLFDSVSAPLLYASDGQLSAIVPYSVDGKAGTQVRVKANGFTSDPVALPVASAAPGIFSLNYTGSGQGAILNQDSSVNGTAAPAAKGSIIAIYATGEGQTLPAGIDGKLAVAAPYAKPVLPVQVRINGVAAEVQYAGAAPGSVAGLLQVNVKIPVDTPAGDIPVQLQIGDGKSQDGITVAVR